MDIGTSGGPNCVSCHNLSGSSTKHIDVAILQNSVHKNLNGALNDINKSCYACHGDGTAPISGHPQNYTNPKLCDDCHTGTGLYGAPKIAEHNQNGSNVIISATCDTCHDNNGMFLPNSGTNGMTTAYGHYVKDITNRSTNPYQHNGTINTSNCNLCHNGAYTNNSSWGAPVNISTSLKRAHSETQTSQCDVCHNDGTVPTLANVDFHNASIKLADATDCIGCHTSATGPDGIYAAINTASFTQHRNVNNTDGGLTNSDCTTCHTDISNMMASGFTTTTKACSECHTGTGVPNAVIIDNHRQNGVNISTGSSCANCHNNSVNSSFAYSDNATVGHYETKTALIGTQDCTNCHKDSVNGTKWGNALDPANSGSFPHSITNTPKEDCYVCHNSAVNFHNKTLVKPSVTTVNCLDCHKTTATMAPKKIDATVLASGSHKNRACENCHANATDINMNTYSLISEPAKTCTVCHTGAGQFNAPLVAEHNQNGQNVITGATCTTCHSNSGMYLTNTGTNGSSSAITHYIKDVTNTSTTPYLHLGPLNTSNCIDCHNGPNTTNPLWGSPVNISNSTRRAHTETQTAQCDLCHNDGTVTSLALVDFHNASLQGSDMNNCLGCHSTVTSADLGLHSNFTGNPAVESIDCKTCHFGSFPMVKGAVNSSNTYFCADCHTTAGTAPNKSTTRIFTEKKHGQASCMDCHVADGIYHQGNPRGSVANSSYVTRYSPPLPAVNGNYTDCADCHYAANLDDGPFNAPGGGTHISSVGGSCTTGGGSSCHAGGSTLVATIHKLSPKDNSGNKPAITIPTLNSSTVTSGSDVTVNATVSIASLYELVDGAQYRIISDTTEIQSWTPMSAVGGNFGGSSTSATAMINTSTLTSGTYSIEVRGMAGGAAQNSSIRYYPINGDVSTPKNATLTVVSPMGYINVTVKSAGVPVPDANVWITDNDIKKTDANGNYTFIVPEEVYNVTASKQPIYNDNTAIGIVVTTSNTTSINIDLVKKSTGTITGTVTNV